MSVAVLPRDHTHTLKCFLAIVRSHQLFLLLTYTDDERADMQLSR